MVFEPRVSRKMVTSARKSDKLTNFGSSSCYEAEYARAHWEGRGRRQGLEVHASVFEISIYVKDTVRVDGPGFRGMPG